MTRLPSIDKALRSYRRVRVVSDGAVICREVSDRISIAFEVDLRVGGDGASLV